MGVWVCICVCGIKVTIPNKYQPESKTIAGNASIDVVE